MVAITTVLSFVALFIVNSEGRMFQNPCYNSPSLRCDNGICIRKHEWCDNRRHCTDNSDEKYCQSQPSDNSCNDDIHFKCDSGRCIPAEAYCDGYPSCPDQSDEKNCPCEELNKREGNFQYKAWIDMYRTQQKCWKISVNEAQYLQLQISATFKNRKCEDGNVTIYSDVSSKDITKDIAENASHNTYGAISNYAVIDNDVEILCPDEKSKFSINKYFIYYKDVSIRYRSNFYTPNSNNNNDILSLTFHKIDRMCKRPDAFRCSQYSCISPEKECDGNKDCENGKDEINCDDDAYLRSSKMKAVKWVRSQHNADWSWKENTHRAVIALSLADDANFNSSSKNDDLIAKQLELELFTYLLRHKYETVSPTVLAFYINALLVICQDPRNFYGYDLIDVLKEELESSFAPPFLHLTLCNAKEPLSENEIESLFQILETSSPNRGFFLELQALVTLTLTCLKNNGIKNLEQNITYALNDLKSLQMEDGSFGNAYTTALVLQALIANNQEYSNGWNYNSSIQFLSKKQESDGSFGDFLTTYLIIPILNRKSLLDIGKVNCTINKRPRDGNDVPDIQIQHEKKIIMKYSLFIGDELDQIHPVAFRAPENITVLELMTLAADIDPKYKFKLHEIRKEKFIYEISSIPNDPENNKFWFIYHGSKNEPMPFSEQSPDKIKIQEKEHIIMWYKTLDSLE